jgi:hypothetical protein
MSNCGLGSGCAQSGGRHCLIQSNRDTTVAKTLGVFARTRFVRLICSSCIAELVTGLQGERRDGLGGR